MANYCVFYNSKSNSGHGEELARKLSDLLKDDTLTFQDMVGSDLKQMFASVPADTKCLICGGDGTLNYIVNHVDENDLPNEVWYFPAGTGNDFTNDIGGGDKPQEIRRYLVNLPTVTIKGKTYKFINGVGYGIDGYCCEEGDRQRAKSDKPVNYTSIAILGLLFHFKPANAVITVDGKKEIYKKVWLAPMMNGRYYGGGMMPTPDQDRLNPGHQLSLLVWYGSGKIPTLAAFPGIFKGEHVKKTKMCKVLTGHDITVEFDAPIAAQVDGDTILAVTKCEAHAYRG